MTDISDSVGLNLFCRPYRFCLKNLYKIKDNNIGIFLLRFECKNLHGIFALNSHRYPRAIRIYQSHAPEPYS